MKFLQQEDRFTYIASGSLLGVTLSQTTSIPMGSIRKIQMYPLDFEEFLLASGVNEFAILVMGNKLVALEPLEMSTHNKIMDLFKKYLLVGGLPDAVKAYVKDKNMIKVRYVQTETHEYYGWDASKYDDLTVLPLEVKSGKDYTIHSALSSFMNTEEYNIKKAYVLFNEREIKRKNNIIYLPVYFVMFIR